jgi:hypothetical protein
MICSDCVSFKNSVNHKKEIPELHGKSHEETMALLVDQLYAGTEVLFPLSGCCMTLATWQDGVEDMRALEDDLLISTLGKVKIEHTSWQLHRCFTSTSTTFLWALFPVTMAASYLNLQSFVNTSSHKHLAASWGGLHWERQIRASARRGSVGTSRLR